MLRIDNTCKLSESIWEIIEKFVCRATVFDRDESTIHTTLDRYAEEKFKILMNSSNKIGSFEIKPCSVSTSTTSLNISSPSIAASAQPPPPPPPPPPTLLANEQNQNRTSDKKGLIEGSFKQLNPTNQVQVETNFPAKNSTNMKTESNSDLKNIEIIPEAANDLAEKLPQQCVPKPNSKVKQLIWSKIHPNRLRGKESIWTKFKDQFEQAHCESIGEDSNYYFKEIEEYFKVSENPRAESIEQKESNLRDTRLWNSSEKINLLDSKRSLNINIYLKQFRW